MIYATEPIDAYNHARRLKTLKCLTPVQFIWMEWQAKPDLYQRLIQMTVAQDRLVIEVTISGWSAKRFHALQQASTITS